MSQQELVAICVGESDLKHASTLPTGQLLLCCGRLLPVLRGSQCVVANAYAQVSRPDGLWCMLSGLLTCCGCGAGFVRLSGVHMEGSDAPQAASTTAGHLLHMPVHGLLCTHNCSHLLHMPVHGTRCTHNSSHLL